MFLLRFNFNNHKFLTLNLRSTELWILLHPIQPSIRYLRLISSHSSKNSKNDLSFSKNLVESRQTTKSINNK